MNSSLKRIFATGLFLVFSKMAFAQTQILVVWQRDGQKEYYDLGEYPKTKFSGTDIVIETGVISVTYPLEKVLRYTYETVPTGINGTQRDAMSIHIIYKDDVLKIYGLAPTTSVFVYATDGHLVASHAAGSETPVEISLSPLPHGVYFVKVNDVTYKILKQ